MNTTTTEAKVGWVSDPNGRGTAGLVWGCFATLYLSTWSMMHPNVPGQHDSAYKVFWRKMLYMTLAVIAPEIITVSAVDDLRRVWRQKKTSDLVNPKTKARWSLKQYFFLDMGGFVLQPDPDKPDIIVPYRHRLVELFDAGEVSMPDLTDADIEDRNKANWFTKSLTIIQVGYFIVQLIGRWAQSLPTTTLELFTLSIVFYAVLTYAAWWAKPFDIQKPIILPLRPNYQDRVGEVEDIKRARLIQGGDPNQDNLKDWIGLAAVTPTFAAIHLVGWNFSFPTQREQTIWRVGSILSGAVPFLWATTGAFFHYFQKGKSRWEGRSVAAHVVFMTLYLVIRIILGVEMLVNLRCVPSGVYKTPEWSEYFPWFS